MSSFPSLRLRRLRHHPAIRDMVKEVHLASSQLVMPLFIRHGHHIKQPILSMPGHYQYSVDQLQPVIEDLLACGIRSILLFGIPEHKDATGSPSCSDTGIIQTAIRAIKTIAPALLIITDICLCEYTDHGHCGVIGNNDVIENDATLEILAKQAVSHARAGADIVAPSGMMDGMVKAIRAGLDAENFTHIPILSYAVKYASHMYGPFRDAAEGAPKFGDRRTHQMDFRNYAEAIRECEQDVAEGADMLMVKPAHTYLDIIRRVKDSFPTLPLAAYHTSGEFAMLKAAAEKGWVNEMDAMLEVLIAIRRAGADVIITYYAQEAAKLIKKPLQVEAVS